MAGLVIAIFYKEKRILGLLLMLGSIVIALIGFSICSVMFRHGPRHHNEEDAEIRRSRINYFILKYAPTYDSSFCFANMTEPEDRRLSGHIYFENNGKMIRNSNKRLEWDSLRIETGIYKKYEDSIVGYFEEKWVIPYTSLEIHSIEKLDFKNALRKKMDTTQKFILLNNFNCKDYPFHSKNSTKDTIRLVYFYYPISAEISEDLVKLVDAMNEFLKKSDELNK